MATAENKPKRPCGDELVASRCEEILEQAALLFAQRGYAETDTQLLAETIGVGKGTVYRYFPSKRELFLAAADRVMVRLFQRVEARMAGIEDPLEQVLAAIRGFLEFFHEHPEFVELLIQERAQFRDRTKPTIVEHRERNRERWSKLYQGLIDAGRVREMPVERICSIVGHVLYGTIFTNYFTGQQKSVDEQAEDLIDVVFHGIMTPAEQARRRAAIGSTARTLAAARVSGSPCGVEGGSPRPEASESQAGCAQQGDRT